MCLRSIANALSRHLRLKLGCYRGDKTEFGHVDYTYTYFEGFVSSAFWFLCIMTKHRTRVMGEKRLYSQIGFLSLFQLGEATFSPT